MKKLKNTILTTLGACAFALTPLDALADANPHIPFYGWGTITATPAYPIVGEEAQIAVTISNNGDLPAQNVQVRISFNDWGATFAGWQEIATVTINEIPIGGSAVALATHVFETMAHTCLEAVIVNSIGGNDPNDDRGQINLEVVSADGQFWYQVPVRNEGNEDLNVLVVGHCEKQDGTAQVDDRFCKAENQEVVLGPGEEILVPVEINLHGVPPGGVVDFVLDVYDLGAADPYAPANHNHIQLRVVRDSAKNLKKKALTTVEAVAVGLNGGVRKQVETVARSIKQALQSDAWSGDSSLTKGGGAKVFAQEEAALNQLLHLLKSDVDVAEKAALNAAALQLTDADRILAQNAGGTNPDVRALIGEGDAHRAAGDYHQAVVFYKKAWQAAN